MPLLQPLLLLLLQPPLLPLLPPTPLLLQLLLPPSLLLLPLLLHLLPPVTASAAQAARAPRRATDAPWEAPAGGTMKGGKGRKLVWVGRLVGRLGAEQCACLGKQGQGASRAAGLCLRLSAARCVANHGCLRACMPPACMPPACMPHAVRMPVVPFLELSAQSNSDSCHAALQSLCWHAARAAGLR